MATVVVTGCNRGIGFQLCKQLSSRGDEVIGVCRMASDHVRALGIRLIEGIDVGADACIDRLREALGDERIDLIVNNAGILRRDRFGEMDYAAMLEQYQVNTLGPLRVTEAMLGNLCLLYTSPSPRDATLSRMPSSA